MKKDITGLVIFDLPGDEFLPIVQCVCGKSFDFWSFTVSIYENDPIQCPECGRKFIWSQNITVWEVE